MSLTSTGSALVPSESRVDGNARLPRGFRLFPGYVGTSEQRDISRWIRENVAWTCGWSQGNRLETYVEPSRAIPAWARRLGDRMVAERVLAATPDYVHLIDYPPGNGIGDHVDKEMLGPVIAGLTLESSRVLELSRRGRRVRVLLLPGDLYVLSGPSRRRWKHGIPADRVDLVNGREYVRVDGLSATFRTVVRGAEWISDFTGG